MSRKKADQGTHDRKVKEIARGLREQGYKVQADVSGYETPEPIGKNEHVPDIFATRGNKTKIIEVDTPGTEDAEQLATFRKSAAHRDDGEFQHVLTKPRRK